MATNPALPGTIQYRFNGYNNEATENSGLIRNVWRHNLEEEFFIIRQIVKKYKFIAVDTEFPGVVIRNKSKCGYKKFTDDIYTFLKSNVDKLKLIQLGLSFFDENGKTPVDLVGTATWQFNFEINLDTDDYAQDSIELLIKSGIQFDKHKAHGILPVDFAENIMMSGLVLMEDITFVVFHGCYDFGYLTKMLTNTELPPDEKEFVDILSTYFPTIYDVEQLAKTTNELHGGLQNIAMKLGIKRIGNSHQAGSDSLLTGELYFKLKKLYFGNIIDKKFMGKISGLSSAA